MKVARKIIKRVVDLYLRLAVVAQTLYNERDGQVTIEYVLITAIITVGIAGIFAPTGDAAAFGFYDAIRSVYRRALVVVSLPLL